MEIEFEQEYLRELYEEGKTANKKKRFQPQVIKQFKKAVDQLKNATKVEDLFVFRSLNYEKLSGNKKGIESVRVNDQFRIEFKSRIEVDELHILTICSLLDLTNHYK